MPHAHGHVLADWHRATPELVDKAIAAATAAQREWASWPWEDRAAVFLKAAELLSTTWRSTINAATMLGQSKTAHQAEIDSACELIDFLRFNVAFAEEIYGEQLVNDRGVWNRLDWRPLEGFVYAITPFNFTAIGGNLSTAPALMGNTVLWKPAASALLSGWYIFRLLEEAGLPPGVINFVPGNPLEISQIALAHRDLAGIHFTGSTGVFDSLWKTVAEHVSDYRGYPRIVGETGGKDFIVAHPSADPEALAVAIARGGFEYQGQKCSAASRVYIPRSLWREVRDRTAGMIESIRMGDVRDLSNFMGAVIDQKAFDRISGYLDLARESATIVAGGKADASTGYFVSPTLIETQDPEPSSPLRGDLRPGRDRASLQRRAVERHAVAGRSHRAVRADRRRVRARSRRRPRGDDDAAPGRRQLLHQRQADRRGRRTAAVRRRPPVRHQRQGRLEAQSPALDQRPHDQGDVRAADRLPLSVHGARLMPSPASAPSPDKVNIADKLARFSDHFQPKIVGELNGQHVKLVKFQGEFVWHSHEAEDEMFLVLQGAFDMQFRDKTVRIGEGEFLVVPRGVEHCPKAEAEVSLMLFEPAGTVNTGTAGGDLTVPEPERI